MGRSGVVAVACLASMLACRGTPSTDAPRELAGRAAPSSAADPFASLPSSGLVVVRVGAPLFAGARGEIALRVPPMPGAAGLAMRVAGQHEGRLAVVTLNDAPPCAGRIAGLEGMRLQFFVDPGDLVPVRTDECAEGEAPGSTTAAATDVASATTFDSIGAPPSTWVSAGAAVTWLDGSPAGTVVGARHIAAFTRPHDGRRCLDIDSEADATPLTLCFAADDVTEPDLGAHDGTGLTSSDIFAIARRRRPRVSAAGKLEARGSLDGSIIQHVVRRHRFELERCHDRSVAGPDALRLMTLAFAILPSGAVDAVEIELAVGGDPEFVECLREAIGRWSFPQPRDGATVLVRYPLRADPL